MLKYCKTIIEKVEFHPELLAKEIKKSLRWLKGKDAFFFKLWCHKRYKDRHPEIVKEVGIQI